jgi:flagella basal body P-ring formation protein FlgA
MGDAAVGARFLVKVGDTRTPVQAIALAGGRATLPGWGQ